MGLHLAQLGAEHFRRFESLSLRPHRRLNFLLGDNAAGKTSLLEMIYVLGRGRSFRGNSLQECVRHGSRGWRLRGRYERGERGLAETVDLGWSSEGLTARSGGQDTTRLELIRGYPVQILEPGLHKLLQEGPSVRRGFLDWGVFHVEPSFVAVWRRFQRALRQRNLALRTQASAAEIEPWTRELASAGEALHGLRRQHVEQLRPRFQALVSVFLDTAESGMELAAGWSEDLPLRDALQARLPRDRQAGLTQDGPQRAELRLRLHSRQAKAVVSRGQQKLLIAALLLSQCELIARSTGAAPLLLVDDFASELGEGFQQRLLAALQAYAGQLFITGFERPAGLEDRVDAALFHVEQGLIRPG